MMIDEPFSSTIRFHQRNVSPLTTPPGFPPSVPRPTFWVGSLMSLIIKKRRCPARKDALNAPARRIGYDHAGSWPSGHHTHHYQPFSSSQTILVRWRLETPCLI